MNRKRCLTLSGVITAVGQAPFLCSGNQSYGRREKLWIITDRARVSRDRVCTTRRMNTTITSGIGAVVNISGKQETKVVDEALRIVETLEHRAERMQRARPATA